MERLTVDQLFYQFQLNSKLHFTGRLDVKSSPGHAWSLYFQHGHVIWAVGSINRLGRWYFAMRQFCPMIPVKDIHPPSQIPEAGQGSLLWEYSMLASWVKQQRVSRDQASSLIENAIAEVLLDIFQNAESINQLVTTADQESAEDEIAVISAEQILRETLQFLEVWCDAGLAHYSANLALVLKRPEALQQQASPATYFKLKSLLEGSFTFRRLAIATQQSVIVVIRSLAPFVQQGLIGLQDPPNPQANDVEPDAAQVVEVPSHRDAPTGGPRMDQGLILCVDDSPQICRAMENILTSAGYRFTSVQDPLQALPTALRQKPNLIFLDLVMPVANGYEICAQLRQVSALKNTPVVILTGKDGIIDRVRAKVVDASGFLAKPVNADKILGIVQRYLRSSSTNDPMFKTHINDEYSEYSFIS